MHLLVDGYTSDSHFLKSGSIILSLLDKIPAMIGMTKISEPVVKEYTDGANKLDWGLSGFVLIAESHISIHTFPTRKYVNVDVFSCKTFDHKTATQKIAEIFSLYEYDFTVLQRGIEYLSDSEGLLSINKDRLYLTDKGEGEYE